MTYTPINWQTGDTITAEKMNKMDNGWSVESGGGTQLFSETVVTENDGDFNYGVLAYSEEVPDGNLTVTFDSTDYQCVCADAEFGSTDESFEDYPFYVFYSGKAGSNAIETATDGTHTIAVSTGGGSSVEFSSDFQTAVTSAASAMKPLLCVSGTTTYDEMSAAMAAGRVLFFKPYNDNTALCYITGISSVSVGFVPEIASMTASFVNGVFDISWT